MEQAGPISPAEEMLLCRSMGQGPPVTACPPTAKGHRNSLIRGEEAGRRAWIKRAPAEGRKASKIHLSAFSSCTSEGLSRAQVRAGNSRVIKRIMGRRRREQHHEQCCKWE